MNVGIEKIDEGKKQKSTDLIVPETWLFIKEGLQIVHFFHERKSKGRDFMAKLRLLSHIGLPSMISGFGVPEGESTTKNEQKIKSKHHWMGIKIISAK